MHVVTEGLQSIDGLNDVASEVPRVRSSKTHASNPRNFSDRRQQLGERALPFRVAVGVDVLAEQLDLGIAQIRHLAGFGKHRSGSTAAFLSASEGHNTVRAELIAPLDDGDVAAMRVAAGGELGLEALVGLAIVQAGDAAAP